MKNLSLKDKKLLALIGVSVVVMIFGILFLVNAMGIANFYKNYAGLDNALAKYIVVILTMTVGIMLWSNVAMNFENKKLRNGLTIGITAFALLMTLPLTYVLIAIMPFAASHNGADVLAAAGVSSMGEMTPELIASSAKVLNLNAIDGIMGTHNIYLGFEDWFGEGALLWVVLVFMGILGVVFLAEPLAAGICVVKGKQLALFGKNSKGKFAVVSIVELPVLRKMREAEGCCDGNCTCCAHAAEEGMLDDAAEEIAIETVKDAAADVE